MITITEICLEELDRADEDDCLIRCVALPGTEPGLALDGHGKVRWRSEDPDAYGLWTTADGRLALLRNKDTRPIVVEREERTLEAPVGQPVILLDQDLLRLDGRVLRVHVHGEAVTVHPPERLLRSSFGGLVRAAAAAASLLMGQASLAAPSVKLKASAPIELRRRPPSPPVLDPTVSCRVDRSKRVSSKLTRLWATCGTFQGLSKGLTGSINSLVGGKYQTVGVATIKSIKGLKIVAETGALKQPLRKAYMVFRP